jgi:hypothetical protein
MTHKAEEAITMKVAAVDLVWNGEWTFDAPLHDVWRHVIDYPSWQNYSSVEHVSGQVGCEGEVVLLRKDEPGFEFPPYYARTIKLDPPHWVIWKTFPMRASPENQFSGIVEFRLNEASGRTRYWFQSIYEFSVPHTEEAELHKFRQRQNANMLRLYDSIYPKLQALIGSRAG